MIYGSDLFVQHAPQMLDWIEIWEIWRPSPCTRCRVPHTIPGPLFEMHWPSRLAVRIWPLSQILALAHFSCIQHIKFEDIYTDQPQHLKHWQMKWIVFVLWQHTFPAPGGNNVIRVCQCHGGGGGWTNSLCQVASWVFPAEHYTVARWLIDWLIDCWSIDIEIYKEN